MIRFSRGTRTAARLRGYRIIQGLPAVNAADRAVLSTNASPSSLPFSTSVFLTSCNSHVNSEEPVHARVGNWMPAVPYGVWGKIVRSLRGARPASLELVRPRMCRAQRPRVAAAVERRGRLQTSDCFFLLIPRYNYTYNVRILTLYKNTYADPTHTSIFED